MGPADTGLNDECEEIAMPADTPGKSCLPKDIKIRPAPGRLHIFFDDAEIVSTTKALELDEPGSPLRYYVPLSEVRPDMLLDSDTRTTCPYKGTAHYFHLRSATATANDAVWYYPDPCEQVAQIEGHVAFWGNRVRHEIANS
jgi:uncharacterized protein (DUF427 family)